MNEQGAKRMRCMEVWGGSRAVNSAVTMSGLDAWVYSKPQGEAQNGGDVHFVSSCASGRITRLLVADVSGHGEVVAGSATALRDLMRRYINFVDQSRFVKAMNRQFAGLANEGDFATAVVATFFLSTRRLAVSNAGHPPPLIWRSRDRQWGFLQRRRADKEIVDMPWGVSDRTGYGQVRTSLQVGDLVVCYTDALVESRDRNGRMLGTKGLLEAVRTLDVSRPSQVIGSLLDDVAGRAHGNLTDDDVTVLLFSPNGTGSPLRDNLLAPARLARDWAGSVGRLGRRR